MALQRYQSLNIGDDIEKLEPATHHNYGLKITLCQKFLLGVVFLSFLFLAGYISFKLANGASNCLGPPYLYISHHDSSNVLKYSRDGCPLAENVLWFGRSIENVPGSIRSMVIHPYNGIRNALFVANAGKDDIKDTSRILVFGECSGFYGMRSHVKTLVDLKTTPGAQHAYSIAFDTHSTLYASFQHTDAILRFSNTSYQPMRSGSTVLPWFNDIYSKDDMSNSLPPLNMTKRNYTVAPEYYSGTFVQFGYPGLHDIDTQGVRAIVWVESKQQLWIANENLHKIVIVDITGKYVGKIKIKNPVGLILDEDRGVIFAGSKKGSKSTGSVYGIDIATWSIVKTFTLLGGETMSHPTGLAVYGDTLFVAEQSANVILTFSISTERFIREVIGHLDNDGVEDLVLSDC